MRINSTSGGAQGPGNINQLIGSISGSARTSQAAVAASAEPASQVAPAEYNIEPLADENAAFQSAGVAVAAILAEPEMALASQAGLSSQYLQGLLE